MLKIYQIGRTAFHLYQQDLRHHYTSTGEGEATRLLSSFNHFVPNNQFLHEVRPVTLTGLLINKPSLSALTFESIMRRYIGKPLPIIGYFNESMESGSSGCSCQNSEAPCKAQWVQCYGIIKSVSTDGADENPSNITVEMELLTFWRALDPALWMFGGFGSTSEVTAKTTKIEDFTINEFPCSCQAVGDDCQGFLPMQYDSEEWIHDTHFWYLRDKELASSEITLSPKYIVKSEDNNDEFILGTPGAVLEYINEKLLPSTGGTSPQLKDGRSYYQQFTAGQNGELFSFEVEILDFSDGPVSSVFWYIRPDTGSDTINTSSVLASGILVPVENSVNTILVNGVSVEANKKYWIEILNTTNRVLKWNVLSGDPYPNNLSAIKESAGIPVYSSIEDFGFAVTISQKAQNTKIAQSFFLKKDTKILEIDFYAKKVGNPLATITFTIEEDDNGKPSGIEADPFLALSYFEGNLTGDLTWHKLTFTPQVKLNGNRNYWLVAKNIWPVNGVDYSVLGIDTDENYINGELLVYQDNGEWVENNSDLNFKIYAEEIEYQACLCDNCFGPSFEYISETIKNSFVKIDGIQDFWNAPPLSIYYLRFVENGFTIRTSGSDGAFFNQSFDTIFDLNATNTILADNGYPAIDHSDIIVLGDFSVRLGNKLLKNQIIIRGGAILPVQPVISYPNYFPGMLLNSASGYVVLGAEAHSSIHFFRRL